MIIDNNMVGKLSLSLFLLVVGILMFSSSVFAFGVAPSQYSFDIDEDIDELKLKVINSQNEDLMLSIRATGELGKYIDLPKDTIAVRPSENEKTLHYKIDLPDELPSGISEGAIVVKNIGGSSADGDSVVSASVAVRQKIKVFSPYPDRYLDGDLFVQSTDLSRPVTFSAHVKNKGSQATDVSGSILIRTPANAEVGRVSLDKTHIEALSAKKLRVSFDDLENPGVYIAEAHLNYGDEHLSLEKQFMVGNKEIVVNDVSVDEFRLGEIVRLDIDLMNDWNQKIRDVSAEIEVLDDSGTIVDTSETTSTDIKSYDDASLEAFWDTEGIDPGTYDIAVRLLYDDVVSEYYFDAAVGADSIKVSSDELSGKVAGNDDDADGPDIYTIVVLLIIAIIVINISWFVLIKKKMLNK